MAKDMIWRAAEQWGYHYRKFEREASSVSGTMQAIREYGFLISTNETATPYREWPEFVQVFHNGWTKIPEWERGLILDKFKANTRESALKTKYGFSRSALYKNLRRALEMIELKTGSTLSTLSPETGDA